MYCRDLERKIYSLRLAPLSYLGWILIHQTLSLHLSQAHIRTKSVSLFPEIMAVIKLREIQRQILRADMVERANHTPF